MEDNVEEVSRTVPKAKAARTKAAVARAKGLLWVNPQGAAQWACYRSGNNLASGEVAGTTTKVAQRAMTWFFNH